jgi:hypothetical protein
MGMLVVSEDFRGQNSAEEMHRYISVNKTMKCGKRKVNKNICHGVIHKRRLREPEKVLGK